MHPRLSVLASFLVLSFCAAASAEDAYYRIPVEKLRQAQATQPATTQRVSMAWQKEQLVVPRVVMEGGQECYLSLLGHRLEFIASDSNLLVRAAPAQELSGALYLPNADGSAIDRMPFKVSTESLITTRKEFLQAKLANYRRLQNLQVAGGAWYRSQANAAAKELGETVADQNRQNWRSSSPADELDNTFALFGGGRAIAENLQLDRALIPATQPADESVKLADLKGIVVKEMDWKPLIRDKKPELDPLASIIPADQHAVFFPTFAAAIALVDESQRRGSILLMAAESRSEDAMTQARYERQLCLPLSGLGRLLGPKLVKSVAVTGSDPYLRAGSDVAVIFQAVAVTPLEALLNAQLTAAAQASPDAKPVAGATEGVAYTGLVAPDRSVSTYRSTIGDAIVVTNSLAQLKRIVAVHQAKSPALAAAPEYIFFRDRYKLGDQSETALIVLSDATIRRWCGPKWRLADSRRTRAAAILSDLQAEYAQTVVTGAAAEQPLQPDRTVPRMGEVRLTRAGVVSAGYGSADFMTPIIELDLDAVTQSEADAYRRWRDSYQQNWRNYFDPIAVRLSVSSRKIGADLTVMPLIAGTEYAQFLDLTRGASLAPTAGDPHPAIGHFALALNPDSRALKGYGSMLQTLSGNLRIEPLAWVGASFALYADGDPFWAEFAAAEDLDDFMQANYGRLPVALYVESRSAMKLAAFLTAVRAFAEQASPGLTRWETLECNGQPYAKVTASEGGQHGQTFSIYYASLPSALVVSLNEGVVKRAIDRLREPSTQPATQIAATAPATRPVAPWLGANACLRLEPPAIRAMIQANRDEIRDGIQAQAWSNILILNEWKRQFPDKDPLAVHQRLFGVRLVDPAGGSYRWNEQWQTMESTNFGHPGEPKADASPTAIFENHRADFGLTFENQGIRARAQLEEVAK